MYDDPSAFGDSPVRDIGTVCTAWRTCERLPLNESARLAGERRVRRGCQPSDGGTDQSLSGLAGLAGDWGDGGDTGLAGEAGLAADTGDAGDGGLSIDVGGAGCTVVSGATVTEGGVCGDAGLSFASSLPGGTVSAGTESGVVSGTVSTVVSGVVSVGVVTTGVVSTGASVVVVVSSAVSSATVVSTWTCVGTSGDSNDGPARAMPPNPAPSAVPAAAAIFQLNRVGFMWCSVRGWADGEPSGGFR
jgi:hypothetical protein